jgi:hypothetical protein
MGIAYVLGFVALIMPAGLVVRELFLGLFLAPELMLLLRLDEQQARETVVAAVVVLRVTWTIAELLLAAVVWWLPIPTALPVEGGGA